MKLVDELAREGSAHHFVGPEPAVGVSRQRIRSKIQCWLERQHLVQRRGLAGTMRQTQGLITGTNTAARTALMSFNRAQSRVIIGLLTGHNTLRRHLHIMGLVDSPLCRKCGAVEETSAHVLCECEALATLRHIYLGSFFLDPENVRDLSLRAIWNFFRRTGLLWLGSNEGQKGLWRPTCNGTVWARPIFTQYTRSKFISRSARMRTRLKEMRYLRVDKCAIDLFPILFLFVRLMEFVSSYIISCRIYCVCLP
jgi:hypothetical protein